MFMDSQEGNWESFMVGLICNSYWGVNIVVKQGYWWKDDG